MCIHTTTTYSCGHRLRNMLPTSAACARGQLHAYGPDAVFHRSKVARICVFCEKGNDERAERVDEVVVVSAEVVEVVVVVEQQQQEAGGRKRGFYWGRDAS